MSSRATAATLSVDEVATILGISRNHAFRSVQRGEIPSFRLGRRLLIPASFLDSLLAGQSDDNGEEWPSSRAFARRTTERSSR